MSKEITEEQLLKKLAAIEPEDDEQRNDICCSLIGHSRIQSTFFGYFCCGRCGTQVGDSLGSVYDARSVVIIGHDCDVCRKNYAECTWKDKIFCPDPFEKKEVA